MKVFMFHLMPWPHLPGDYQGPAWVWVPNSLYDPAEGHCLYNRYLDELRYADELGFDGVCMNEHHQNAYGNMPSPNLVAFALARETSSLRLVVLGNALPLYDPPQRVAEEYAMIDVVSGGRLTAGLVIGGGPEYYSFGVNPATARERFREALDLVVQAWTRPGPFEFEGRYYSYRYVNPWPRPLQRPHPPIWIPGGGSIETIEYVAERRYAFMGIPYFSTRVFKKNFDDFRDACERVAGYTAHPEQLGPPAQRHLHPAARVPVGRVHGSGGHHGAGLHRLRPRLGPGRRGGLRRNARPRSWEVHTDSSRVDVPRM